MNQVQCRLEIPNVDGLKPGELTVGRHLYLNCAGEYNKSFDFAKSQIKLEESHKFVVKVLKAEARSANSFDLDLAFYVAGQAQFPDLILTDGSYEISLGQQQFQLQSVLEKTQTGEPPKPYSFLFPLKLEWPALYFILLALTIVLFLTGLILRLRQSARYAKLIAGLEEYNSASPADLQFYKSLRQAEKKSYPLADLEMAFKLYVLRVFKVPMFVLNHRQIVKFMKKRKSIFRIERSQVQKLLGEFDEMRLNKKELTEPEKLELVNKLYRFVDKTQRTGKTL